MDILEELSLETEAWAQENIRACQVSIALMAEIREKYQDDWEIEELTRAIMFDEAQLIKSLQKEVEVARETYTAKV